MRENFEHAWAAYRKHGWSYDEVTPISGHGTNNFGGWRATLIDSLDTLWLMNLTAEFDEAVAAVAEINFRSTEHEFINVFETTIRYLGGLLGAYDVSSHGGGGGDRNGRILMAKAIELGELVYAAFDTPNRMPVTRFDWNTLQDPSHVQAAGGFVLVAELASLTVEMTRLSQLTGDGKYYDAVARVTNALEEAQPHTRLPGLWPIVVNASALTFDWPDFTLGGMADSAYEYLPKAFQLLGGREPQYRSMYEAAIAAAEKFLFFRPMTATPSRSVLVSGSARANSTSDRKLVPEGQHLACFAGGMLALGSKLFSRPADLELATKLTDGCLWAYESMPTGIMPERFSLIACPDATNCPWDEELWLGSIPLNETLVAQGVAVGQLIPAEINRHRLERGFTAYADTRYTLRPEAIEAVFYMYRVTGEGRWMERGWEMFERIVKVTRTGLAHTAVGDVTRVEDPGGMDRMESYWLAETLKYFFLLFSEPETLSLDEWVFNTEAHPFRLEGRGRG